KEWVFCQDPDHHLEGKTVYAETTLRILGYVGTINEGRASGPDQWQPQQTTWVSEKDLLVDRAFNQAMAFSPNENPYKGLLVAKGDIVVQTRERGFSESLLFRARFRGGICANDDVFMHAGFRSGSDPEQFDLESDPSNLWKDGR